LERLTELRLPQRAQRTQSTTTARIFGTTAEVAIDEQKLGKIAKGLSVLFENHPWTVMRGSEIKKWIDARDFGPHGVASSA
jgi:hypothetical protein